MIKQKIHKKYLDKSLLNNLLIAKFGAGGFQVEVESEVYILAVPQELTEAEIETCRTRS
ncbi:uncharacterized protein K444DRAFT_611513 [Hyaloscypha bicolor E]|uniref:Uncharacterized protein n=1 Tax=Hyaloscypha bicolor E TaxID=1095630 RepID=A0A2J6TE34_9HELO|nr:uncharacterized protein K444DRAFT_611513 [Hyaloscypha bicolor E]PMD61262.1 hypothetical protein K444DRAFT_611513 [Hyaloscypha bicolor E]